MTIRSWEFRGSEENGIARNENIETSNTITVILPRSVTKLSQGQVRLVKTENKLTEVSSSNSLKSCFENNPSLSLSNN